MRDMFMVPSASNAGPGQLAVQPELTPEQELQARFRLLQVLQTSLSLNDLLALFYKHVQPLVSISGIKFTQAGTDTPIKLGRESIHQCDYRLTMDDGDLGSIVFSRNKRFAETEMVSIEQLLSYLVHPLRNAIKHQNALKLTMLDPLTLVGNRTALDTALRRELQLAERYNYPLSLLVIDVDHFKHINDSHGHVRGDMVLQEIAKNIQSSCRGTDECFRYGGEEFVVLLRKTKPTDAQTIAERIRTQIQALHIGHNGQAILPTVSIGIAGLNSGHTLHVEQLFEQADQALYAAKAQGRNRVMLFGH